jgi:hypothetical protein
MPTTHPTLTPDNSTEHQAYLSKTRHWMERVVIGLNLCPFAKAPAAKGAVHLAFSPATTPTQLTADLVQALQHLVQNPATETTLLVHPFVLGDFESYNDYLDVVDQVLEDMDLLGVVQVASFHPDYQFAGTQPDDPENNTNRSPYPTLHLIREESLDRAVDSGQDADTIVARNIETMNQLGPNGYTHLMTTFTKTILFTDTDGRARFTTQELPLGEGTPQTMLSALMPSGGLQLRQSPVGFKSSFHCTTTPQWLFVLQGAMQIFLQDGSSRVFKAGEHFYSNDTLPPGATFDPTLHGHASAQVGDEPLVTVFVRG